MKKETEKLVMWGAVLVVVYLVIRYEMQQSAVSASPTGGASSFLSTLSPAPASPARPRPTSEASP